MRSGLDPFQFLLFTFAGWVNQHQQRAVDYLMEENRVLREHLGARRLRFTDDQRRRLAVKAKALGRKVLSQPIRVYDRMIDPNGPSIFTALQEELGLRLYL